MAGHTCAKLVFSMFVIFVASSQAARADEHPWADTAPSATAASQMICDQYAYFAPARANLSRTTTGMPQTGTYKAPGNLALRTARRAPVLPPTRLDSFVKNAGSRAYEIYGKEGEIENVIYEPIANGFDAQTANGLTTGHQSDAPSLWAFPTMDPAQ